MLRIKRILVWLFVFSATITPGLNFFHSTNSTYLGEFVHRQFGNAITINIFTLVLIAGLLIGLRKIKIRTDSILLLLLFSIMSLLIPNGKDLPLAIIGLYSIVRYSLYYTLLVTYYDAKELKTYIGEAFCGVLIFETVLGFLQVFAGIKIPFLSTWSTDSTRNGLLRMAGSFSSGPEFGLFTNIILVFILCEYLFDNNKSRLKYVIIAIIDLWFSGSRTMIMLLAALFVYLAWKKYRRLRGFITVFIVLFSVLFVGTSTFRELFIENSITNMFITRLVHWRSGTVIFLQNFFFGVGLNNSLLYLQRHSEILFSFYNVLALESTRFYLLNPIHNSFLIMFSELGIFGGSIFAYMFFSPLIQKLRNIRRTRLLDSDNMIIISEMSVFIVYGFQGWGLLKEFSWIMIILIVAYNSQLARSSQAIIKG